MAESLTGWLSEHPPPPERFTQTLATVARRGDSREGFGVAVRELLDEYGLRPPELRAAAIVDRPDPTGDARQDAYLAALAEHLALRDGGAAIPAWTAEPARFLERFWFVSPTPGFRAIAIARSPLAFRRRGIFITPDALDRR